MAEPLDRQEKARVRHHTGYPEVQPAASMQFGLPKPLQTAFLLESAMENLMPEAVPRVREILQICDDLEQQMINAQCALKVDGVGTIKMAGSADPKARLVTDRLESEYVRWAMRLVDIFGVPLYPFSERFRKARSGGNVPRRRS